ncbi:glycoside hydrolase family 15 protein [Actinocrispum wychmicini]|uniref:Glycosyl hydrolase family 15 n=1 Tax=Actinocrispum wychmicini TaxID=1213861 RepID=A0A4R2JC93_9PSEU|nr:glycoside hydrolase family 15 protein [Actinocrispum wychmicini]TCO56047.1 glycosyl hydrolase family 15 [Actinocrispum wychmicini]
MKLSRGTAPLSVDERTRLVDLARQSHAVITRYQDVGGAYPASPTFSAYRGFAWLRDGSFTAEGISRYGDVGSANRFHDWSARVLTARRSEVDSLVAARAGGELPPVDRMLPTRFTFTGENGSDPWWDFQTDGYGMWLWSAVTHAHRHGVDVARWLPGFEVAVDYLLTSWDRPCYDWWEEHVEHRHVSTLGAVRGGLVAVADLLDPGRRGAALAVADEIRALVLTDGVLDGHLTKWLGSSTVDGSLPSCVVPFGLVDGDLAEGTLAAVAASLDVDGGVHRFTDDVFYGGGQWLLLSALLGWNLAARGDLDGALRHLRWIAAQADTSGQMPEQVPHHLLHPGSRDEWIARWGTVASPLLWSHGMYLILADELGLLEDPT